MFCLENHSIAATFLFRRLQLNQILYNYPKLYRIGYHSFATPPNTYVFDEFSFTFICRFLFIILFYRTLKPIMLSLFHSS